MKILCLDNDHVLNTDDDRHETRYLPLNQDKVKILNGVLRAVPDLQIVVSSAWRYHVHAGRMTLEGLAEMYMHFGMACHQRVIGVTDKDPYHWGDPEVEGWTDDDWYREGLIWRRDQILKATQGIPKWAALDDLALDIPYLFKTDRDIGLTKDIADSMIAFFGPEETPCLDLDMRRESL